MMKVDMWLVVVLVLLAALQTTLLGPMFLPEAFTPNLLLGFVVLVGLFHGKTSGLLLAFLCGYIGDLGAGGFLGVYMSTRIIAFWVARTMAERVLVQSPLAVGMWAGIMAPGEILVANIIYAIFSTSGWENISLGVLLGQAITTMFAVAILHSFMRKLWVTPGENLLGRMNR